MCYSSSDSDSEPEPEVKIERDEPRKRKKKKSQKKKNKKNGVKDAEVEATAGHQFCLALKSLVLIDCTSVAFIMDLFCVLGC